MIEVSETAREEIREYFQDREPAPIRIFLMEGGCCGPQLAVGLDEPQEDDQVFAVDELTFIVDQDLMRVARSIRLDMDDARGFTITSETELGGCVQSGGGCPGCQG